MGPHSALMPLTRREFLYVAAASAGATVAPNFVRPAAAGVILHPQSTIGSIAREEGPAPLDGAVWHSAESAGSGLEYRFDCGAMAGARYVTSDMLLDGNSMIMFQLSLQEGEGGRKFTFQFGGLNQCSFRVRMPLSLVDQNRWGIEREAAFLKPRCGGDRIDLSKVDRMTFVVLRKSPRVARWCMTPFQCSVGDVPRMDRPLLTKGALIDELGQSTLHDWPAKTRGIEDLKRRLRAQLEAAPALNWPATMTRWGGSKGRKLTDGAGFFRTHNDGRRWWLVDPDGYAFWSAGIDCVRVDTAASYGGLETALAWLPEGIPEYEEIFEGVRGEGRGDARSINFLAANFIRAFGQSGWREKWARIAFAQMRRLRFNTVGNWSEWSFAKKSAFPYVRPLSFPGRRVPYIYRDFPDVYHPSFARDVAEYAAQLADTRDDPAFIGYFLMNEPEWGFSSELPVAGMLYNTAECPARKELADWLRRKYRDAAGLSSAWGIRTSFERVSSGRWEGILREGAKSDLQEFSVRMTDTYFRALSQACRKIDPNHLNLGMRWAGVPPKWAVEGMRSFDVFSINCYQKKVPRSQTAEIHAMLKLPVIIGEWHFGALDAGLPSSGIGHLKNQSDRGKAYRAYLEDAAANPVCVGAHWFTLYDESALGRFDGENYNIGFLDVCNRPYEDLGSAAIASHEAVYEVASGSAEPFSEELDYLPNLF